MKSHPTHLRVSHHPLRETSRNDAPTGRAHPPADSRTDSENFERIAASLETIATSLSEARACAADRWARLRANLPWVALWVVLLISNLDRETRTALLGVWTTLRSVAP